MFSGIAWSFKLGTIRGRKKMAPIIVAQAPHLDIPSWLNVLDLPQYLKTFERFTGVEELMYFCEADIKQLGVKNSAHRARIVTSLVALRDKYERGQNGKFITSKTLLCIFITFITNIFNLDTFRCEIECLTKRIL